MGAGAAGVAPVCRKITRPPDRPLRARLAGALSSERPPACSPVRIPVSPPPAPAPPAVDLRAPSRALPTGVSAIWRARQGWGYRGCPVTSGGLYRTECPLAAPLWVILRRGAASGGGPGRQTAEARRREGTSSAGQPRSTRRTRSTKQNGRLLSLIRQPPGIQRAAGRLRRPDRTEEESSSWPSFVPFVPSW